MYQLFGEEFKKEQEKISFNLVISEIEETLLLSLKIRNMTDIEFVNYVNLLNDKIQRLGNAYPLLYEEYKSKCIYNKALDNYKQLPKIINTKEQ